MVTHRLFWYYAFTMKHSVTTVIFDFGNVISRPQDMECVKVMSKICGLSSQEFAKRYKAQRLELDRGTLSAESYWNTMLGSAQRNGKGELIRTLIDLDVRGWSQTNAAMLSWARVLKSAGYSIAVLSNMPDFFLEFLRKNAPWLDDFDQTFFSCELRMVKPEKDIYLFCLGKLGIRADEALFIDDTEENIDAARHLGMYGHVFRSNEKLAEDIREHYALPPFPPT